MVLLARASPAIATDRTKIKVAACVRVVPITAQHHGVRASEEINEPLSHQSCPSLISGAMRCAPAPPASQKAREMA